MAENRTRVNCLEGNYAVKSKGLLSTTHVRSSLYKKVIFIRNYLNNQCWLSFSCVSEQSVIVIQVFPRVDDCSCSIISTLIPPIVLVLFRRGEALLLPSSSPSGGRPNNLFCGRTCAEFTCAIS